MSDKSGIEWTEATWNPTTGCTKVSPGCKNCYAKHQAWPRLSANPKGVYTGRVFEDVQVHPERLDQPLRWTRPRRIFVNSMSDLFHEDISDDFIDQVFAVMMLAKKHIFQVLTKRAERMEEYCNTPNRDKRIWDFASFMWRDLKEWSYPLSNVWLGVSVENQETAFERIPLLRATPAAVRWLSCEPLLDKINLSTSFDGLHWVVVGGESGKGARPMEIRWAQRIRNQCNNASVPFFMKQGSQNNWDRYKDFESFPPSLQVREYPR